MGSALPIKIENPIFHHGHNFNYALRSRDCWGNSLVETECTIYTIIHTMFMYVWECANQRLAAGGGRRRDGVERMSVRSHTAPSVGTPVCSRLRHLREEANICIPSRREPDETHITCESLNPSKATCTVGSRLRRCLF